MRIPFIPKNEKIEIHKDRYDFIKDYRGGGFMLMSGAVFWLLAFLLTFILNKNVILTFYIWGGLLTPIMGIILYKLLKMSAKPSPYSTLVGFASAITVVCIPILLLIKDLNSEMILPVLCIINASHLLILCWVHLDYWYFILVMFGVSLGSLFIFTIPGSHVHYLALIWGIGSLIVGITIHLSTKSPLKGYHLIIKK